MAEEEKPNDITGDFRIEKLFRTEADKAAYQKQLYEQYVQEMKTNERIQAYFTQFEPGSVGRFIEGYAQHKARCMTQSINFNEWLENESIDGMVQAAERLEEIQQKKLFDLQCQWRAEKITLEGIEICMDFKYWESHIMSCPFLPPITADEVELYSQYLRSSNVDMEQGWFDSWQDYEGIKEAYETDDGNRNFPEWYDFYNGRKGTGVYLLLPDIRGAKEKVYIDLWRAEHKQKEEEAKAKQVVETDPRPYLTNYPHNMVPWFVATFEDKKTQEYYKAYGDNDRDEEDELLSGFQGEIGTITHVLQKARTIVPVQAWHDYREALERALEKYELLQIADAMPAAYEEYLLNLEIGLGHKTQHEDGWKKNQEDWRNIIRRGRELNGEPPTLDF